MKNAEICKNGVGSGDLDAFCRRCACLQQLKGKWECVIGSEHGVAAAAAAPQSVTCQAKRRLARRRCLVLKVGCALVYVCVRYYCAPSWPGCDSARRSERAGAIIRVALLTDRPETLQQQSRAAHADHLLLVAEVLLITTAAAPFSFIYSIA